MNTANDSLRVRVTPYCNLKCGFCHDEGGDESCQVKLDQIVEVTEFARKHGFAKFHLTGGEPTLHPDIIDIVHIITGAGYPCGITTNGQFQPKLLSELKEAGVTSINFSIHTVETAAWAQVQQHADTKKAEAQIARATANVRESVSLGIRTKVNIVVGEDPDLAIGVIEELRGSGVEYRLLNVLGSNDSLISISHILTHYSAEMEEEMRVMGSSQYRATYTSTVGNLVVKEIHQHRELTVCKGCKENCQEGFYGIRIIPMEDLLYARLCVHRTSGTTFMPLKQFETSPQLVATKASGGLNDEHKEVYFGKNHTTSTSVCGARI